MCNQNIYFYIFSATLIVPLTLEESLSVWNSKQRLWYPDFLTQAQVFSNCRSLEKESTARCHDIE